MEFHLKFPDYSLEVIPDDPEERLAFYDNLLYEAYKKNLKLEIWNIGIGMSSSVEGDYCLICYVRQKRRWIKDDEEDGENDEV